jgi:Na+/proline symporter
MHSLNGLIFGIINIVGNFGTVFVDNAYWQRAIAARPSSTVKAYLIGGLAWFAIPFTLATTMGLAGVALQNSPNWEPLSKDEVDDGLVVPNAAKTLLGTGGAVSVLILVFMAVTSASSAELIAISAIFTYDIYRTYIHPGVRFVLFPPSLHRSPYTELPVSSFSHLRRKASTSSAGRTFLSPVSVSLWVSRPSSCARSASA